MTNTALPEADYHCHVFAGCAFSVVSGANLHDPLLGVEELCAGDTYRLSTDAQALQVAVSDSGSQDGRVLKQGEGRQRIAQGSEFGLPGATLQLSARLTFLAPEGHKVDLLLLTLSTPDGPDYAALPLEPVEPGRDHTLIGIDAVPAPVRLADITSLGFGRGTRITLADGKQVPVEALHIDDRILTRDHGPQPLRQILRRTVRAVGPFAPVVIPRDTFGNDGDLILSQQQRLFIYQRDSDRLTETAEMLIKSGYLVDNEKVFLRPGGYSDFYTLVFDHHEVIYAECIPVESLEVNAATRPALPDDIAEALPDLDHAPHIGTEANRGTAQAAREKLLKERRPIR